MEKNHFEQAKLWLNGAHYIASLAIDNNNKYAVAIAMSVHAIIKANDASKMGLADRGSETSCMLASLAASPFLSVLKNMPLTIPTLWTLSTDQIDRWYIFDTLTFKFMAVTAKRHDDARRLFEDLIKKNFVKPIYADYKNIIQDAITNKAKAEYRGAYFSKADFEDLRRKAEKFIKMAEEIVI